MEQSSGGGRPSGRGGTRQQTHEIVIDAPVEAVWKAIADGEELTRWFVEEATVEPGVGGTITISWGGDEKSSGRIEVWEPNRKLRKKLEPFDMGAAKQDPAVPMIDEYTIERRDGKTVLRLVSSGIPDTPEWDGFYNGTDSGWGSFFRTLKHYLEHHSGKPRTTITVVGKVPGSLEDGWARLTGPAGFGFQPVAGHPFSIVTVNSVLSVRLVSLTWSAYNRRTSPMLHAGDRKLPDFRARATRGGRSAHVEAHVRRCRSLRRRSVFRAPRG